jgi:hypothetical protein
MPENWYWNACQRKDDKIELLHIVYHEFADCKGCIRNRMVMPDAR